VPVVSQKDWKDVEEDDAACFPAFLTRARCRARWDYDNEDASFERNKPGEEKCKHKAVDGVVKTWMEAGCIVELEEGASGSSV
jgi:hypothetical protein